MQKILTAKNLEVTTLVLKRAIPDYFLGLLSSWRNYFLCQPEQSSLDSRRSCMVPYMLPSLNPSQVVFQASSTFVLPAWWVIAESGYTVSLLSRSHLASPLRQCFSKWRTWASGTSPRVTYSTGSRLSVWLIGHRFYKETHNFYLTRF